MLSFDPKATDMMCLRDFVVLLVLKLGTALATTWINADGTLEYCETEMFHAECGENEVVVMRNANYGRMRFGRCVERDYGYVGCAADVMRIADRWCSGRRSCDIPIPNSAFRKTNPCPGDLKPYLEASYHCISVETGGEQRCEDSGFLKVGGPAGYLARVVTEDTGRGSANCPWLIQAAPGQLINISLIDFSHSGSETSNYLHDDSGICHVTAILREKGESSDATTVCSGGAREKQVHTSASESLEVRILGTKSSREPSYFLLRYEVIGCDAPRASDDHWVRRDGGVAEVGCHNSDRVWLLECDGNEWQGHFGNCTDSEFGGALGEVVLGSILMPLEASVVMVISIAVIMGVIILISGLICLRWRLSRRVQQKGSGAGPKPARSPVLMNGNGNSYNQDNKPTSASQESFPPPPPPDTDRTSTLLHEHDYSYISAIPPPPPPVTGNGMLGNGVSVAPPGAGINPPPHSPRTASTSLSQSSPGSYKSYKCYMQSLQNQSNSNYERMASFEYGDTPPGSPSRKVPQASPSHRGPPMPKLLAHECALAIRGDKSVVIEKRRHSRGQGSIGGEFGVPSVHSPRRSRGGTPTYYELEPGHSSTAFPFPPPSGFATISSPKNQRSQQAQEQQGIYHVRSPKKVDGKNTL